jgi:putative iron-only hydrogenase system regulator
MPLTIPWHPLRELQRAMGIPIPEQGISLVSIAVLGDTDEINSLTGKLGKIEKVSVKTAMSKRDF